ncbi:unnamed protein product [Brassicogethes aeneus]|uniref:Meiosis-specific nuclear structural protein 1 n=1 Tax=Brassicogethes aeneus TaxID=1431903 RepID=A0A9P0BBG8_BRAAE|nr:unnamed protein product [Brassicogethes aeneus]
MEDDKRTQFKDEAIYEEIRFDEKSRFQNLQRYLQKQRHERELHNKKCEAQNFTALRNHQFHEEENLAYELDKIKREEIVDKKFRQQLRESSEELRDLERKLQLAYGQKELAEQIAEKQAEREYMKIRVKEEQDLINKARVEEAVFLHNLAEEKLKKTVQYRNELQDQMIWQEKKKRFKYEEFLREKKMIDHIVERIHEEDERDRLEKMCKMQKTKEEMIAFKQAQEIWKQKKKEEIEEENRKIHEFMMSKASHAQAKIEEKHRADAEKTARAEKIIQKIFTDKIEKQKKEDALQELLLEEMQEASDKKHKEKMEKEFRTKIDVRESLMRQMEQRIESKQQEAVLDAEFKREMLEKHMEESKLEQLSDQKRRLKAIQIRKDVEQMMFDKRQKRAEDLQIQKLLREQEEITNQKRLQVIEEERMNMLKQHYQNLIGFLPKGIFKPGDLTEISTGITQKE